MAILAAKLCNLKEKKIFNINKIKDVMEDRISKELFQIILKFM